MAQENKTAKAVNVKNGLQTSYDRDPSYTHATSEKLDWFCFKASNATKDKVEEEQVSVFHYRFKGDKKKAILASSAAENGVIVEKKGEFTYTGVPVKQVRIKESDEQTSLTR